MDMSYATIPVPDGSRRFYCEKRTPYVVSSQDKPEVHHIYAVDTDLGSSIFFNDAVPHDVEKTLQEKFEENNEKEVLEQDALEAKQKKEGQWIMYFDGSVAKVGAGAGVYIISPIHDFKALSYKLLFECTNNVAEYEALLLGLHALKYLGAQRVRILGDSELVINQVNESYQTKHPRMRAYRNEVWDMLGNFFTEHTIQVVPRVENLVADSLAVSAGKFETPMTSQKEYQVEILNRPSIPDNYKYWQVFEDDMQIRRFLELSGEFVNTHFDNENDNDRTPGDDEEIESEKDTERLRKTLGGKDIIQLKNNFIPRGLIPLERLFDQNDVAKNPKVKPVGDAVEDKNIGTEENPKILKLSQEAAGRRERGVCKVDEKIYRCVCLEL